MPPVYLPRHVDDQQMIFLWKSDEFLPCFLLLCLGVMAGYMLTGLGVGIALMMILRRFRDSRPDGYLLHALYWYGLFPIKARSFINPFERRVLP